MNSTGFQAVICLSVCATLTHYHSLDGLGTTRVLLQEAKSKIKMQVDLVPGEGLISDSYIHSITSPGSVLCSC